jgi:TPR repeat protein
MDTSANQPHFVTCPCQYCSGKIEFDANQFDAAENTTVPCPHCGLETIIFVPEQRVPPIISTPNKYESFKSLFNRAQKGDRECQYLVGIAFLNGEGITQDVSEALKWIHRAAEGGYPIAQLWLGEFYRAGEDYAESRKWYHLAADNGNADAQYALGVVYGFGQGVPKDSAEAAKWYRMAAEQGHSTAQNNLGVAYDHGEGVALDKNEALKWFRLGADNGDTDAQFNLALHYCRGEGVAEDWTEAVKWSRKAAEQGNANAQFLIGAAYWGGEGVLKDSTEAVKWLRLAAEQGHPRAQFQLGFAYESGEGIAKDYAEANRWFHLAAERGDADAQYALGLAYGQGEGVPQNFVEAYKWTNLAATQNLETAKQLRETLVQQMTPSQIEEGQRQSLIEASKIRKPTNRALQDRRGRAAIPSEVRREVWRRDGGKCVKCGSRTNLEYDHIVPISKGGSNTARNIELLCESCNRAKSDSIQ